MLLFSIQKDEIMPYDKLSLLHLCKENIRAEITTVRDSL